MERHGNFHLAFQYTDHRHAIDDGARGIMELAQRATTHSPWTDQTNTWDTIYQFLKLKKYTFSVPLTNILRQFVKM